MIAAAVAVLHLAATGLLQAALAAEPAPPRPPALSVEPPPRPRRPARGARGLAELADWVRPAVVHVRGVMDDRRGGRAGGPASTSVGSGFLVDRAGAIITNEHVIRGANDLRVRLYDGREFPTCVLGIDELADIALLKIESRTPLPALALANSDRVRVGEPVLAIGSPFGFAHSVTAGIVSATERVVEQGAEDGGDQDEAPYAFFIQTDASINVGNSGGPLVDGTGAVIGVNAAFWGGAQPSTGVGFAIPVNVVKLLLPQLRDSGAAPRSYLGVESQPVTPELAAGLGLPSSRGALISGIDKGSAAEAAGLEVGDVVTSFGAHALATRDDFRIFSQLTPPGTKVKLGVLRPAAGQAGPVRPLDRTFMTRAAPRRTQTRHPSDCRGLAKAAVPPPGSGSNPDANPAASLGFEVRDLPRPRAAELPGGRGVQVARIFGGPAQEAKLAAGDIILRIGRTPVGGAEEVRKLLAQWKRQAPLPLLVRTRSRSFWTALRPY